MCMLISYNFIDEILIKEFISYTFTFGLLSTASSWFHTCKDLCIYFWGAICKYDEKQYGMILSES